MKKIIIIILTLIIPYWSISSNQNKTEEKSKLMSVEKLENADNLFHSDRFYFSGQPSEETLSWLKNEGVELVINLRAESENAKHTKENFDEEKLVKSQGTIYVSLPLSSPETYCPETVEKLAKAIEEHNGKILIHCASCGRVTNLWMAYLIKFESFSVDEAIEVGKQLKFTFPLEDLLGKKISMSIKE